MGPTVGRITPTAANQPILETVCAAAVIDDTIANTERLWIKVRFTTLQDDDIAGGVIHGNLGTSQEEASGINGIPIHIAATDVEYYNRGTRCSSLTEPTSKGPPTIDHAVIAQAVAAAMAAAQRAPADAVRLDPTPVDRANQIDPRTVPHVVFRQLILQRLSANGWCEEHGVPRPGVTPMRLIPFYLSTTFP